MKKFDWDAFGAIGNKIAVWCKTEEEAIDFCRQSHENGYDWRGRRKRNELTYWEDYREETCYIKDEFTEREYYEVHEYLILEWSDYMATLKPTFTKSDLKDGDMVLRRNGAIEVAIPSAEAFTSVKGFNPLSYTDENLKSCYPSPNSEWDIMEVRRPTSPSDCQSCCFRCGCGILMFKREELVKMTLDEVCKALGKKIKIVGGE